MYVLNRMFIKANMSQMGRYRREERQLIYIFTQQYRAIHQAGKLRIYFIMYQRNDSQPHEPFQYRWQHHQVFYVNRKPEHLWPDPSGHNQSPV